MALAAALHVAPTPASTSYAAGATADAKTDEGWTWGAVPVFAMIAAGGVALVALANRFAAAGADWGDVPFFIGLIVIVVPDLAAPAADRRPRLRESGARSGAGHGPVRLQAVARSRHPGWLRRVSAPAHRAGHRQQPRHLPAQQPAHRQPLLPGPRAGNRGDIPDERHRRVRVGHHRPRLLAPGPGPVALLPVCHGDVELARRRYRRCDLHDQLALPVLRLAVRLRVARPAAGRRRRVLPRAPRPSGRGTLAGPDRACRPGHLWRRHHPPRHGRATRHVPLVVGRNGLALTSA